MRNSGLGLSAFLIAAGAVLRFAVTYQAEGVDLQQVGTILMLVGAAVGLIAVLATLAGDRTTVERHTDAVVDGQPVVRQQREVVVEHRP